MSTHGTPVRCVAVGGLCGLAWSAGLRGFMAEVAGADSTVEWTGTFVAILLPGMVTGALLGWAEYGRRTGGRQHAAWLLLAPLAFPLAVLSLPGGLEGFVTAGLGGLFPRGLPIGPIWADGEGRAAFMAAVLRLDGPGTAHQFALSFATAAFASSVKRVGAL